MLIAVLALAGGPPHLARAAAGDLDPGFGQGGMITTTFGGSADARAVAIQPDGKIVAAGSATRMIGERRVLGEREGASDVAVARYRPDATLDGDFGVDGRVTTDFGGHDAAVALIVQPDGKLVVAGSVGPAELDESGRMVKRFGPADVALARYNPDGTLDPGFGREGKVVTDLGDSETVRALVIQPDGKLVVAGTADPANRLPFPGTPYAVGNMMLIRYSADGSPDPTFGTGGTVITRLPSGPAAANALALQPDGKLIVAGDAVLSGEYARREGLLFKSGILVLVRHTGDGFLDDSFGTAGVVLKPSASANALVLQPDDKLVTAGSMLVRFNPDGTEDTGFGSTSGVAGTVDPRWSEGVAALALQADGRLLAVGFIKPPAGREVPGLLSGASAVFRYNPDGSPDSSFGSGGMVTTTFGEEGFLPDILRALAIQEDGQIVVAGMAKTGEDVFVVGFGLARYQDR